MLGALNDAVLEHMMGIISDMGLVVSQGFISPVDDIQTHFKLGEQLASREGKQLKFPFLVAARGQAPQITDGRITRAMGATAYDVPVTDPVSGEVNTVRAAAVRVEYIMNLYSDDLDFLDLFLEHFILNNHKPYEFFSYFPEELQGQAMDGSFVFGDPVTTATDLDTIRDSGLSFVLALPINVHSVLTTPIESKKVIETIELHIDV